MFKDCQIWDEAARSDFLHRTGIVANGTFGAVSFALAKRKNKTPVAIKSLILANEKETLAVRNEITHLRALHHLHVVALLDVYWQPKIEVQGALLSRAILLFERVLDLEAVVVQPLGEVPGSLVPLSLLVTVSLLPPQENLQIQTGVRQC